MALIKCKDCENDVSDSAAACPRCGAPVPRAPAPPDQNQMSCPHCSTRFDKDATVCPSCDAVKGYSNTTIGVVGAQGTVMLGIVCPILMIILMYLMYPPAGSMAALILAIPIISSAYRLLNGPYWYHRR